MIIDKMKILDHLTIQEKYLVDYIINNQEDILKKNINELAKLSYTSSATISGCVRNWALMDIKNLNINMQLNILIYLN